MYSLVIPVFNEEAVLPILLRRLDLLMREFDGPAEAIFVDDGSRSCSGIVLRQKVKTDERFRYVGCRAIAITAGIEAAGGAAVIVMDADLQDPPEVILDMIARWTDGYAVSTAAGFRATARAGSRSRRRAYSTNCWRSCRRSTSRATVATSA